MKLTVKPEARQSVFAGATSPDEQRAALAKYLEQDQPSGISIELTPEERASIGEVTPSSVLNFARQKVGGKPSTPQVAPSAGSSLGPAIDMTAFDAARRVASIPRRELRQMPSQTVEAYSEIMEMGLRSSAAPRVADKIDKETRSTLKGSRSTFEKFFDYVDAGFAVPAIGKLVSRRAPALLSISRPMFSVLSANADIAALKEMTPDDRRSWLATVEDGQPHKEVYTELVDRLDNFKPPELQMFGAAGGFAKVPGTVEDIGLQDLKMKLAGVYFAPGNTADPYGGGAPRPWSNDAVDAVDVVMRGALGFDADDVSKNRPKVRQISNAIGAPFRELASFAKATPEVFSSLSDAMESKDFVPILKAMGLAGGGVEFASDWFDRYKRQAELDRKAHKQNLEQDRSAGMTALNLAVMAGPDFLIPGGAAARAARLVDTPIGKIAREAEAGRLLDAQTHSSRIIDEATELRGRKLTPEEESELRVRTGAAVDILYSAARDNKSGVVRGVDTTDAIRLVDADEGLLVVPDTSKITLDVRPKRTLIEELARPIEGERNLFPDDAPVVRAAKAAGGKIVGMIDDDEDGLGIVLLTGAEKMRQVFGKGPPIVVLDKGKWRKPRAGDVVGDSQWRLFRNFVGARARSDMNFLKSEVTDAAKAVWSGTANPQQRIIVGKLQEINGRPSEAAVSASELWQSVEDQVNKALKIAPDVLDDLSLAEKAALNAAEEAEGALVRAQDRLAEADVELQMARADDISPADMAALQKAKADAEVAVLEATPAAKSARLAADDASVLRESTEKKLGSVGPSADSLEGNVLGQIDTQAQRARILADIMESMTGSRSAAAAKARADLGKELRMIEQAAATAASDATLIKALDGVSLASARKAERAWNRAAKNGFKDFEEFDSLPPEAKAAAETVRDYFASVYRRLVAAGKLRGDTSLEEFYERNLVEGYIPHMLSKAGRKSLRRRLNQSGLDRNRWSEVISSTAERTKQGTIEEINQTARERVADMIRRDAIDRGQTPAEADELFRDWMERLKDDIYFENDPLRILPRYAENTARGLANTAMIKDVIRLFPDGERFTSVIKDIGVEAADKLARQNGYRRVDGLTLLRTFNPELALWRGWKDEAIQKLAGFGPERVDEVLAELKAAGAPITDTSSAGIKTEMGRAVYLPMQVADEFDRMASPSVWAGLPEIFKDVFRDYTSVWKTLMTVVAPAFHGRNWVSNVIASYLSNGFDAVSPSTQIKAHRILLASDNAKITIGKTTMSAKDWRRTFREGGVIQDTVGFTGGQVDPRLRVAMDRAALAGAAGAATGATIGVQTAEPGDNRLARAIAFGGAGLAAGASGSANFDLFLRNAAQAGGGVPRALADIPEAVGSQLGIVGQSAANKARWAARKDEIFRDLAEPLKKSGRVGLGNSVVGLLWGLGTGDVLGATALATGGGAAASLASEAAAVLGGSVGTHIEDMAKIGNAIAELKRGGSMSAAAAAARRATFDYADLTRFEKEAFRVAIPFYTWTKKNIALQADLMANNPREYNLLVKAMNASTYEGDMLALDEYYGHRWIVGLGMGSVLAGMGTGPEAAVEILTKGPKGVLASLNPLPKAALERFWGDSGYSFYYKKPPTEITNGRDYEALPKWFQDKVGYRDDLVDPRKPGKKLQPRIGWYELTASELNELSSGSVPYQNLLRMQVARDPDGKMYRRDIERGAYWHQLFSAHPVSRLMREFNKAMKVSYQSALADEQGRPATAGERAANILFSARATNIPEQTPESIEAARREVFLDKMERISDAMFLQDQAFDLRVIPKVYQAPVGKYVPE